MTLSWPETVAKATAHLNQLKTPAYLIELEEGESALSANKMLGAAYLLPSEAWPHCEFCDHKMALMLQVAVADIEAVAPGLDRRGLLQLFLCLNTNEERNGQPCEPCCNMAWGWKDRGRNKLVRVVVPTGGSDTDDQPRLIVPTVRFSDLTELQKSGLEQRKITAELYDKTAEERVLPNGWRIKTLRLQDEGPDRYEALTILRRELGIELLHAAPAPNAAETVLGASAAARRAKVGGWPIWQQQPNRPTCRTCGEGMRSLVTLSRRETLPIWADIYVNAFYCETHPQEFAVDYQST